jgi:peptidoglycan/xylan/chitin deacetylase (PgdA/CDA1 family)
MLEEVESTSQLVLDSVGVAPKFFRPPYIALNQSMFDTINLPFIEGFGCNDWDDKVSIEARVSGILDHAQDGNIILLHDLRGNSKTVKAIDIAIPKLKALGCRLVTVSQLFEYKGVTPKVHENLLYSNVEHPKVCAWHDR